MFDISFPQIISEIDCVLIRFKLHIQLYMYLFRSKYDNIRIIIIWCH